MSSIADALQLWSARRAFNRQRSGFYRDLGASLAAGAPLNSLIGEYARQNVPDIGPMMVLWGEGMRAHPGSLARATNGLVNEDDTVIISAAEMNPAGAGTLYQMYAANLAQRRAMLRAVLKPLLMPAISLVVLIGVLFFFKKVIYAEMIKGVPLKYWPDYGLFAYGFLQFATGFGGACILGGVLGLAAWVSWSLSNYTGPGRDWLDRRVPPYTTVARMNLISTITAISSMIQAGISDTVALNAVATNGSAWLSYQMDKIKAHTGRGKTVLTSLRDLPLPRMLSARIVVLAGEERLADALPELVMRSCADESHNMVERMESTASLVNAISVVVLLIVIGIVMLGNLGFSEASQSMNTALENRR